MPRHILDGTKIHPEISRNIGGKHESTVQEIIEAAENYPLLVVGMAQNPYCKKVRKRLDKANLDYHYIEYGSYLKDWQRRLALKMWSGWATFPMVFVKGQLVGGNDQVGTLLASGELKKLLG